MVAGLGAGVGRTGTVAAMTDNLAVHLPRDEWNKVLAILSQAPWNVANPLIMALGDQLRAQGPQPPRPNGPAEPETTRQ